MPQPMSARPPFSFGATARARWLWPVAAVTLALIPVAGVFTVSRIFFVRDLTIWFWPRHLWLRRAILDGESPLWDPSPGGGQSVVADALHQLFLLPTLAVRLIGPEIVGFNLWVALPFPVAALGAFYFFRRHASPSGAALGTTIFAVSGPVVSTGNFPNLSWSAAFIPWVLWATDRCATGPARARGAFLAAAFATQALSGEPVTLAATAVVAVAYGLWALPLERPECRSRASVVLLVIAAFVAGSLLAAVQLVPLLSAGFGSARAALEPDNFWSLHPLTLLETVMPHLFGNYFNSFLASFPWMAPLNSGREPFYYSLYLGVGALSLAVLGVVASSGRRRARFWTLVATTSLVAALGDYTPIYPVAQRLAPPLGALRFPAKYLLLAVLACAALAVAGWEALGHRMPSGPAPTGRRAGWLTAGALMAAATFAYAVALLTLVAPAFVARGFYELANEVGVNDPVAGAAFLFHALPPLTTRLFLLATASAGMLWLAFSARPERRLARPVLFLLVVADLVVTNAGVNPTLPASLVGPPAWVEATQAEGGERVYYGGRSRGWVDARDVDAPKRWTIPAEFSAIEGRAVLNAQLGLSPSPWGVREIVSYDLPVLWPREYEQMLQRFEAAGREERLRFLSRAGVRYCVLPDPPTPSSRPLHRLAHFDAMTLYECGDAWAPRAYVVERAIVEPDLRRQTERMFDATHDPATTVMLETAPPPAVGAQSRPEHPSAEILRETTVAVAVQAATGRDGGFLVVLDSYAPSWRVRVDGRPAQLLRANALFRAVRLGPGRHIVEFSYEPRDFRCGLALSLLSAIGIAGVCLASRSKTRAENRARIAVASPRTSGVRSAS